MEFTAKAGKGDWEYYFSEDSINNIADKCLRRPRLRSIWIGITSTVSRVCGPLLSLGSTIALAAVEGLNVITVLNVIKS